MKHSTDVKRSAGAEWDDLPDPPAEIRIGDPETLKALTDPLRVNLLARMGQRPRHGWSVKELAHDLGTPVTRLYHHVNLLEERGLLAVAGTHVVSGIIERRYQVAARSIRVDPGLGVEPSGAVLEMLDGLLASARDEIGRAIRTGVLDDARDDSPTVHLARTTAHLTPKRAAELSDRVEELVGELSEPEAPGAMPYAVLLVAHPMSPDEADDDE